MAASMLCVLVPDSDCMSDMVSSLSTVFPYMTARASTCFPGVCELRHSVRLRFLVIISSLRCSNSPAPAEEQLVATSRPSWWRRRWSWQITQVQEYVMPSCGYRLWMRLRGATSARLPAHAASLDRPRLRRASVGSFYFICGRLSSAPT
jgi:hypothetical protein